MYQYHSKSGFSLTELSVVLVITAIIVAGALKGRTLIEAANVRAILSEVTQHRTSLNSFYAKYSQLPGDFNDAQTYWGASNTVNGNANGQIGFLQESVYEGYRAWQHLSYARMIEGAYIGTETTGVAELNSDVPESTSGGGFFIDYDVMGLSQDNVLLLGAPADKSSESTALGAMLTPSMAMDIDAKADDGIPNKGAVRGDDDGDSSGSSACLNGNVYAITDKTESCIIAFRINQLD